MKVVITGSEGFIGSELRRQCEAAGMTVIGYDILPSSRVGDVQMDIRAANAADGIPSDADVVIHLAGLSSDRACVGKGPFTLDVNVIGTLNMFRATAEKKVPQFIFASSEWVYGEVWGNDVLREDAPLDASRSASEYALSKLIAERYLFIERKHRPEVAVTVLRFGIVYGPRPVSGSAVEGIFNEVRTLETVVLKGSVNTGRRFVHVSDIAGGIRSAIGRTGYETYNISGNTMVTLGDVIAESAAMLGRSPKVVEENPAEVSVRNPDNSLAKATLGWSPRISLREGLTTLRPGS